MKFPAICDYNNWFMAMGVGVGPISAQYYLFAPSHVKKQSPYYAVGTINIIFNVRIFHCRLLSLMHLCSMHYTCDFTTPELCPLFILIEKYKICTVGADFIN